MLEKELQNTVIEMARLFGWRVMHTRPAQMQSGRWSTPIQGDAGYPDLTLASGGEVLFVELKSDRGRLSPDQKRWLEELPNAHVWRPADLASGAIERALKGSRGQ